MPQNAAKKTISIATWNVNSVRTRLPHLLTWLREDKPDVVLLQELKCTNEQFPSMEIEELGYNIALHGEKTYNGVAILSKFPLDDVVRGLDNNSDDQHSRYIEAVVCHPTMVFRVASVYVPNGQEAGSDKFAYKLRFLDKFASHIKKILEYQEILLIGGDYNIAPSDADVNNPKEWEGSVLTHDEVRKCWRKILNSGVYDSAQVSTSPSSDYTWWDYRANAFNADNGLRIDHFLLSPQAVDRFSDYSVKKELRSLEKPSDHAPVVVRLAV